MPKLNVEHQFFLTPSSIGKILREYGLRLKSFSRPKAGIANTTAIVKTNKGAFALRIYRQRRKSLSKIQEEVRFALFLKDHGIPVPAILPDLKGKLIHKQYVGKKSWTCLLMERIPGRTDTKYLPKLVSQLARVQAKMHILGEKFARQQSNLPRPQWVLNCPNHIVRFNSSTLPSKRARDFFDRTRKFSVRLNNRLPLGYNHMDIGYGNLLVYKGKLSAILDFDDVEYGPIVSCLAYILCDIIFFTQNISRVREYLKVYLKLRKLTKFEIQNLLGVMAYRNYIVGGVVMMLAGIRELTRFLQTEEFIQNLDIRMLL